jgi:hypothetical protein
MTVVQSMKAYPIATAMRVRCDCDARANPRNALYNL